MKLATVHDTLAHTARPRPTRRERASCLMDRLPGWIAQIHPERAEGIVGGVGQWNNNTRVIPI